jgi:hypothetical protein
MSILDLDYIPSRVFCIDLFLVTLLALVLEPFGSICLLKSAQHILVGLITVTEFGRPCSPRYKFFNQSPLEFCNGLRNPVSDERVSALLRSLAFTVMITMTRPKNGRCAVGCLGTGMTKEWPGLRIVFFFQCYDAEPPRCGSYETIRWDTGLQTETLYRLTKH